MASAGDVEGVLSELIGRSARQLGSAELSDEEERELLVAGGVVLELMFDLDHERWLWHLGVDPEDFPGSAEDLTLSEFLQSEVSWRLIEWRDTREQRQPAAAPRLLRAS